MWPLFGSITRSGWVTFTEAGRAGGGGGSPCVFAVDAFAVVAVARSCFAVVAVFAVFAVFAGVAAFAALSEVLAFFDATVVALPSLAPAACCSAADPRGAGAATSRVIALGGLSLRRPWKTAWRTLPSRVHSANEISATSFGSTQVPRASRGLSMNGASFVSSFVSCLRKAPSVLTSKPVPTLPA